MNLSQFHHPIHPSSGDENTDEGVVRMLIAEKHPFKGVENYFIDSLLYQDPLETTENLLSKDSDSGNKADTEPEPEEECFWEINLFVTSINKLNLNNNANNVCDWFIKKI